MFLVSDQLDKQLFRSGMTDIIKVMLLTLSDENSPSG